MSISLREQLENKLGDEMRKVEIDVTQSFLNGKITSPLIGTATTTLQKAGSIKNSALNTAASAGIYITKDGLQVDPSVVTDLTKSIINIALDTTKMELMNIRNKAWADITYIPDPSIIAQRAISYFSYHVTHNINFDKLLDFTPLEDKMEKQEEEKKQTALDKVSYFIDKHLPKVNNAVNTATSYISEYCSNATYYAAFGPKWLSDKIAEGIEIGSYAVSYEVNGITTMVNDFKMEMYNKVGDEIGKQFAQQYEALLQDQVKQLNDDIETNKSKVKIKAQELLQKANLKIMEKTGIKIPLDKISPENLSKIKNNKKLLKFANMAKSIGGGSSNTNAGKPADNTTELTEKQRLAKEMEEAKANHQGYEDPETGNWMAWDDETGQYVVSEALSNVEVIGNQQNPIIYEDDEDFEINLSMENNTFLNPPPMTTL